MMVVAIIGILATIALPKFAEMVARAKEASTKGSLGALRSAMSIYYADTEGTYPFAIEALAPIYISKIPRVYTSAHGTTDIITLQP